MNVQLELDVAEANDIVSVLGQLPTASNAWPLVQKIRKQIEDQTAPSTAATPEPQAA